MRSFNSTESTAMTQEAQDHLAVLIDADNAQASLIEPLLSEIAKYGTASVNDTERLVWLHQTRRAIDIPGYGWLCSQATVCDSA